MICVNGDVYTLLPMETPERIARYARAQSADYVMIDEWYLGYVDSSLQEVWTRAGLEPLGLRRLARGDFEMKYGPFPGRIDRRVLFRVEQPDPSISPVAAREPSR